MGQMSYLFYLEDNRRIRPFLPPSGPYISFKERWEKLQTFLISS
jgi:hypothetical protein